MPIRPGQKKSANSVFPPPPPTQMKAILDPKDIFAHAARYEYVCIMLTRNVNADLMKRPAAPPGATGSIPVIWMRTGPGGPIHTVAMNSLLDFPPALLPLIAVGALTVELYLKALVVLDTGQPPQTYGHTLSSLFTNGLTAAHKKRLEQLYQEESDKAGHFAHGKSIAADKSQYDLIPMLKRNDNTFTRMRYPYELDDDWAADTLQPIWCALRRLIVEIKPEWQKLLDALGRIPT